MKASIIGLYIFFASCLYCTGISAIEYYDSTRDLYLNQNKHLVYGVFLEKLDESFVVYMTNLYEIHWVNILVSNSISNSEEISGYIDVTSGSNKVFNSNFQKLINSISYVSNSSLSCHLLPFLSSNCMVGADDGGYVIFKTNVQTPMAFAKSISNLFEVNSTLAQRFSWKIENKWFPVTIKKNGDSYKIYVGYGVSIFIFNVENSQSGIKIREIWWHQMQ